MPQKSSWSALNSRWVPHDVRDTIVDFVRVWSDKTEIAADRFVAWIRTEPTDTRGGPCASIHDSTWPQTTVRRQWPLQQNKLNHRGDHQPNAIRYPVRSVDTVARFMCIDARQYVDSQIHSRRQPSADNSARMTHKRSPTDAIRSARLCASMPMCSATRRPSPPRRSMCRRGDRVSEGHRTGAARVGRALDQPRPRERAAARRAFRCLAWDQPELIIQDLRAFIDHEGDAR